LEELVHNFFAYSSTYLVLVAWGASGFMAQPSFASFIVHFFVAPVMLILALQMAHWEGRRSSKDVGHE